MQPEEWVVCQLGCTLPQAFFDRQRHTRIGIAQPAWFKSSLGHQLLCANTAGSNHLDDQSTNAGGVLWFTDAWSRGGPAQKIRNSKAKIASWCFSSLSPRAYQGPVGPLRSGRKPRGFACRSGFRGCWAGLISFGKYTRTPLLLTGNSIVVPVHLGARTVIQEPFGLGT